MVCTKSFPCSDRMENCGWLQTILSRKDYFGAHFIPLIWMFSLSVERKTSYLGFYTSYLVILYIKSLAEVVLFNYLSIFQSNTCAVWLNMAVIISASTLLDLMYVNANKGIFWTQTRGLAIVSFLLYLSYILPTHKYSLWCKIAKLLWSQVSENIWHYFLGKSIYPLLITFFYKVKWWNGFLVCV